MLLQLNVNCPAALPNNNARRRRSIRRALPPVEEQAVDRLSPATSSASGITALGLAALGLTANGVHTRPPGKEIRKRIDHQPNISSVVVDEEDRRICGARSELHVVVVAEVVAGEGKLVFAY
jgi:hypothetical protein